MNLTEALLAARGGLFLYTGGADGVRLARAEHPQPAGARLSGARRRNRDPFSGGRDGRLDFHRPCAGRARHPLLRALRRRGGGRVAGIAAGIVFSLSRAGGVLPFGRVRLRRTDGGLFSPVGKIGTAAAFILSNGIISLQAGDGAMVIAGLYEVMAATLIFIVLPRDAGNSALLLFAQRSDQPRTDGLRRSVMMRLDFASKALSDVSDTVDTVSKKLRDLCAPDINGVYSRAIDDTCRRCGLKVFCWEKEYNNTMSAFNDVTSSLRRKGRLRLRISAAVCPPVQPTSAR